MMNVTNSSSTPDFILTDGGRAAAGFRGTAGDCATRAIAIAANLPYADAYALVNQFAKQEAPGRGRRRGVSSARNGVHMVTMQKIMKHLGWTWVSTMGIGTGCTVHLDPKELPSGRIIVRLSKHYAAVIDGVVHDTHNPNDKGVTIYPAGTLENIPAGSRFVDNGGKGRDVYIYEPKRCVYGFWVKEAK